MHGQSFKAALPKKLLIHEIFRPNVTPTTLSYLTHKVTAVTTQTAPLPLLSIATEGRFSHLPAASSQKLPTAHPIVPSREDAVLPAKQATCAATLCLSTTAMRFFRYSAISRHTASVSLLVSTSTRAMCSPPVATLAIPANHTSISSFSSVKISALRRGCRYHLQTSAHSQRHTTRASIHAPAKQFPSPTSHAAKQYEILTDHLA